MSSSGQWRKGSLSEAFQNRGILPVGETSAGPMTGSVGEFAYDPLWTPVQVAERLNVSPDWVRDHSSRKEPMLPVIRLGGGPGRAGLLRYRASAIEKFIEEMEYLSNRRSRRI